jgi:hypothetical protein
MKDKPKKKKWVNVTDETSLHWEMGDSYLNNKSMQICIYHGKAKVAVLYSSPEDKQAGVKPYFVTRYPKEYKLVLTKAFNTYFELMHKE